MRVRLSLVLSVSLVVGLAVLLGLLLRRSREPPSPVRAMFASVGMASVLPQGAVILASEAQQGVLSSALVAVGDDRLRVMVVDDLDEAGAGAAVQEQWVHLASLFEDRQAPYPGQLSHTLVCPQAYRPERLEPVGQVRLLVRLYANDRLAYGGCSDDLLHYRATLGMVYDPGGRRLVRVEYFAPKQAAGDRDLEVVRSFGPDR